jgi:predicted GTPase
MGMYGGGVIEKVIIMGAAGRDFHNFNIYFRGNPRYRVVCFTATQIPDIDGRVYPPELAGDMYPEGIPVFADSELERLIAELGVDLVVFSYSDITHNEVMHKASLVTAAGADFMIAGATYTMLPAKKPVVAVCAVRTGCGKSQVSREIARVLMARGRRVVIVRHPMPYGDLRVQAVQRFAERADLDRHRCTIEEREEYEPILDMGVTVFAGVDYGRILERAEAEADVLVWDGGNNDTPFYRPTVHVTVFDPHRAGHELLYHPGETNMRMCDVAVINKVDTADPELVEAVRANIRACNPRARIVLAESPLEVDRPELIRGKRVLVVEDGPTLTHGGMPHGAGALAARQCGAAELADPRPWLAGSLRDVFAAYPGIGPVLPAMGYGEAQIRDLEATIAAVPCDAVVSGTPIDISRVVRMDSPVARVRYAHADHGDPTLESVLLELLEEKV